MYRLDQVLLLNSGSSQGLFISAANILAGSDAMRNDRSLDGSSRGDHPMVYRNRGVRDLSSNGFIFHTLLMTVLRDVLISSAFLRNIINVLVLYNCGNVVSNVLHSIVVSHFLFMRNDFHFLYSFILCPYSFLRNVLNTAFTFDSGLMGNVCTHVLGLLDGNLLFLFHLAVGLHRLLILDHWLLVLVLVLLRYNRLLVLVLVLLGYSWLLVLVLMNYRLLVLDYRLGHGLLVLVRLVVSVSLRLLVMYLTRLLENGSGTIRLVGGGGVVSV